MRKSTGESGYPTGREKQNNTYVCKERGRSLFYRADVWQCPNGAGVGFFALCRRVRVELAPPRGVLIVLCYMLCYVIVFRYFIVLHDYVY